MSLYRRGRVWQYDFRFRGRRYAGSTRQRDKASAREMEQQLQRKLRRQAAGLEPLDVVAPRFTDWAEIAYAEHAPTLRRPETFELQLRIILRFWGSRPAEKAVEGAPYHDLTLRDPIRDPQWLLRFEEWLAAPRQPRAWSPQTRNHLRTTVSMLYQVALLPQYRLVTGVDRNPMRDMRREPTVRRDVSLTVDELRRILTHASYHVRLALAIGALAPKLRRTEVLGLRWDTHLDADLTWITVRQHKTVGASQRPHVVPISDQLRDILADARRTQPIGPWVVAYRGAHIKDLRGGLRAAILAAGLPYGQRRADGITYHTLRHAMATLLAELGVGEALRAAAAGHADIKTTQRYTHLRPVHERPVLEQLSEAVRIADVVTMGPRRASRRPAPAVPPAERTAESG